MGLINVQTNSQLQAEEDKLKSEATQSNEPMLSSLAKYIRDDWTKAYSAKNLMQTKMLKSLQRYEGRYSEDHLAAIRSLNSSEIFIPLTNIKCRAAEAWLKEVLLQPGEKPWALAVSPLPDVPEEKKGEVWATIQPMFMEVIANHVAQQQAMGAELNPGLLQATMEDYLEQTKSYFDDKLKLSAQEDANEFEDTLDDIFVEGNFYKALEACIHDICIFSSSVMKGPVYRKVRRAKYAKGEGLTFEDVTVQEYERRNPLDIYPAPESGGIDDAYLIDRISLTPKQLSQLKGVEGYNDTEIDAVLDECGGGSLREWTTFDTVRLATENKSPVTMSDSDRIDVLEYWGTVRGNMLIEWGLQDITDPFAYYDICAWLIGSHVIKAMLNPDPLGKKPFSKASFIEIPDAFWGISVSDVVEPLQTGCNAIARAIMNNAAIASGPLVERNIDRIPAYESKTIYPWKMFDSTDLTMSSTTPAYRFYQPPNIADRLLVVFSEFLKQADELSGIPAYAHGDVTVGGAGRTASGLSMLTNNANRGIKAVIRNIDVGLIEPTVTRQYYSFLQNNPDTEIPDLNIVAKGSIALMEKELMSVRRNEFMQLVLNPILAPLLGAEGLKYLLEETAKAHGINVDKMFPPMLPAVTPPNAMMPGEEGEMEEGSAPMMGGGSPSMVTAPPKPAQKVMPGGASAGGVDVNEFQSENGR